MVRGPQSALWGSEAIGGVIAINGLDDAPGDDAQVQRRGSFGFGRASASGSTRQRIRRAVSGALGFQRATGIDSFGGHGDKDGYRNLSGRIRGTWHPRTNIRARRIGDRADRPQHNSMVIDPVTFAHTDTLDSTRNRLTAGRIWAESRHFVQSPWRLLVAGSVLQSSNRNYLAEIQQNRTQRRTG